MALFGLFGPPDVARLEAAGNIDGLVRAAKYRKDAAVREAARRALEGFLDQLIQRLDTRNIVQLQTAREALCLIGAPARDRLVFILREGHVHRRQDAAFVLGMMGDPEAVAPLCEAARHRDPLLRMLAVQALGKIGDRRAVETLRRALGDQETRVAREAYKALQRIEAAGGGAR